MNMPEFFVTPGYGDTMMQSLHYSQAVRVGNRVETSGQGGWDDEFNISESLKDEIDTAFQNVSRTLATAGATWSDVIHVNSYHVIQESSGAGWEQHNELMAQQYAEHLRDRYPIWTQSGVTSLGLPTMRIEIRVTAIVDAIAQDIAVSTS